MFKVQTHHNGIVEIIHEGHFTVEKWQAYQKLMLDLLEKADQRLYILSNFSRMTTFDRQVVKEAGTAQHLTHPNLGILVLLGGNALHNFILAITENRAMKEDKGDKMRVHRERERALETLRHFMEIHNMIDDATNTA